MSRYGENYHGVSGGDFDLMPEGRYPIRVINSRVADSKSSGNPTWYLDLEITGSKYAGRKLWLTISMGTAAAPIRKGTMTALGFDTSQDVRYDLVDDVIGRVAIADVYHDEYEGNKREKVRRLRSMKNPEPVAPERNADEELEEANPDEIPF